MGIVIDADILINCERGKLDLDNYTKTRTENFYLSVITMSEMLHGLYRATDPHVLKHRGLFLETIRTRFQIIPIDYLIAERRAHITASLAKLGQSIGSDDSWIAATCLAYDHTLVTGNIREFNRIEGLKIETWL
jgi:tRNA(fMet)-specific endonuclease VapC